VSLNSKEQSSKAFLSDYDVIFCNPVSFPGMAAKQFISFCRTDATHERREMYIKFWSENLKRKEAKIGRKEKRRKEKKRKEQKRRKITWTTMESVLTSVLEYRNFIALYHQTHDYTYS
jgi:hypothetical protein